VADMGEMKSAYKVSVGKIKQKRPFGRHMYG
jgi:hypothetical protein